MRRLTSKEKSSAQNAESDPGLLTSAPTTKGTTKMNLKKLHQMKFPRTPLVAVGENLLCKLEGAGANPTHKSRSAAWIIEDAWRRGRELSRVADRTSGSWAMGLALATHAAGGRSRFVCVGKPEPVVRAIVEGLGGAFECVGSNTERIGALERLREQGWWSPDQHNNPRVIDAFEHTLGEELVADFDRAGLRHDQLAAVVAPLGTGGTLAGVSRRLRRAGYSTFKAVGVDAAASIVHGGPRPWIAESLKVPGVGSQDEFCQTLRAAMADIDEVVTASPFDAVARVNEFFSINEYSCGMSGGLAVVAAERYVLPLCPPDGKVLVILPDNA